MTARIAALLLVAAAALAAACGSDDAAPPVDTPTAPSPTATREPAAPSPAATPTASAALGESFRAFAAEIDAATRAGDVAFFMERLTTEPVICTEDMVPYQMGGPACTVVGEQFEGFPLSGWHSEGSVVPAPWIEEELRDLFFPALPEAHDEFGGGAPQVYAINASDGVYATLLTAIIERPDVQGGEPQRVAAHTAWEYDGARWRMTALMTAYHALSVEFLRPDDVVRSYYPQWERFAPP